MPLPVLNTANCDSTRSAPGGGSAGQKQDPESEAKNPGRPIRGPLSDSGPEWLSGNEAAKDKEGTEFRPFLVFPQRALLAVYFDQIGASRLGGRGRGLPGGDDHVFTDAEQGGGSDEPFGAGKMSFVVVFSHLMRDHAP